MKKIFLFSIAVIFCFTAVAQDRMTPELLWKLGRVSALGLSKDGKNLIYSVSIPDVASNKSSKKTYSVPLTGGDASEIDSSIGLVADKTISPDGKFQIVATQVKIDKISGKDYYPELEKSNVQIFDGLNFRHWDTWEDGAYSHLFVHPIVDGKPGEGKDIMQGEPFDCPTMPFGGSEDFTWSPDGKKIIYATKKKSGTAYAISTNIDLYEYDIATGNTVNLTEGMMGYDMEPAFSSSGALAWLSMKRDGYEADKNDIIVINGNSTINLTKDWDGSVNHFSWAADGKKIFFVAPVKGTIQLFEIDYMPTAKKAPVVKQITNGLFDVTGIVGQVGNTLVVARNDMNHASEIYTIDLKKGSMNQLTKVNDATYNSIKLSKIEQRWIPTTDGKQMLVYVIFPPDFDPNKKYPTLLYCQGGPQSALSQYYSYRWNFQLMAAQGYIIVAPNRRGMPGHGVEWNEQISQDHGGQVMDDYLSAIDAVAKESYVDKERLGAVGASYGGYSVFQLAGIHNNRFKSFISHCGIFNTKSMYGTTEEMFFIDWEYGGPYWDKSNAVAQKTYTQFDPSNHVEKWNTPILIFQGGKDYRVPESQAFEAFTAAQMRGIKSRLVHLPEENHWVLSAQNAIVWQREFFRWLNETLPVKSIAQD
jgi:dipeptidyl aminopeptidase/acylaminoacyl peptidase